MKDQPMPKAIHGLIAHNSDSFPKNDKTKCNENHANGFNDRFKPILDVTAYPDDHKAETKTGAENHFRHHSNAFTDEFKPILEVTAYPDDHKAETKTGAENHFLHHANAFTDEFKPIPDITAYPVDQKAETKTGIETSTTNFEPGPNISVYNE